MRIRLHEKDAGLHKTNVKAILNTLDSSEMYLLKRLWQLAETKLLAWTKPPHGLLNAGTKQQLAQVHCLPQLERCSCQARARSANGHWWPASNSEIFGVEILLTVGLSGLVNLFQFSHTSREWELKLRRIGCNRVTSSANWKIGS